MQNTITEIKNSLEAANSRIQKEPEEKISEVEDRLVEIMDAKKKKKKEDGKQIKAVSENSGTTLNIPTSMLYECKEEKRERGTEKNIRRDKS